MLKHKEEWVECCVLLDADTLWCYSMYSNPKEQQVVGPLTLVALSSEMGNDVAMVYFQDDGPSCTTLCVSLQVNQVVSTEHLKAKTRQEAEAWMDAILNRRGRLDAQLCSSENEELFRADLFVGNEEKLASQGDFSTLAELVQFERMLSNAILRSAFQAFLTANHVPESLHF